MCRGRMIVERHVPTEKEVPGCVVVRQVRGLGRVTSGEVVSGRGWRGVDGCTDHGGRLFELQRRGGEVVRVYEGVHCDAGGGGCHGGHLVLVFLCHEAVVIAVAEAVFVVVVARVCVYR